MLQNAFDKTLINHFFVSVIEIIERSKQMFLMMGLLKIQSLFGQRPNYTSSCGCQRRGEEALLENIKFGIKSKKLDEDIYLKLFYPNLFL